MSENKYKKKYEFQKKIISRQSKLIEDLKLQNENLTKKYHEKENEVKEFVLLKEKIDKNINEIKQYKKEYNDLINELKKMKFIINRDLYKGRWNLIKFLIK